MEGTVQTEKKLVGKLSKGGSAMGSLKDFKGERGDPGVYVGSGDMPDDCYVQIDPSGNCFTPEDLNSKLDKVDFIPAPPGVVPAAQYANQAYEAYGYNDSNGNHHEFNEVFSDVPIASGYTDSSTIPLVIVGVGGKKYLASTGKSSSDINPQMHLIASGTTTEEVSDIIINKSNGLPLNVTQRIAVFMITPKASANAYVTLSVNGTGIVAALQGLNGSNLRYVRLEAWHCGGGHWAGWSTAENGGTSWGNLGTRPMNMDFTQGEVATEIKLTVGSANVFPIGTKYQVYGIEV